MKSFNKQPQRAMSNCFCVLFSVGLVLLSVIQIETAEAKQKDQNWDKWRTMGQGYVARRKVPKNISKKVSERKLKDVADRLNKKIILRNRSSKKTAKLTKSLNKNVALNNKVTAKLDKQITNLKKKKRKGRKGRRGKKSTSVWLRNQGEGIYSISITELASETGVSVDDVRELAFKNKFTLTYMDKGVDWLYYPDTDSIIYVAEQYDTFHTDQNAYRLSFSKSRKSNTIRISNQNDGPDYGDLTPFNESLKFEEEPDFFYSLSAVAAEQDADYWFWDFLFGGNKDSIIVPLSIPDPVQSGTALIRITLRGWTNLYDGDEHQVLAELNGVQIGISPSWDGFDEAVLELTFDQSILNADGENELILRNQAIVGPNAGQFLDQIEVDYYRLPIAQDGKIWLHDVVAGVQTVSGFTTDEILVIQNPVHNPFAKRDISIFEESDGSFSVSFDVNNGGLDYLVTSVESIQLASVEFDEYSDLENKRNSSDYLIISPREFSETANKLREYRNRQFGKATIVWIGDVYDEFSDGRQDPMAVTRFVDRMQKKWRRSASIIVVLGKGSIDHKDRMGYSDSFVPVVMTSTPWALSASDDRLIHGEQDPSIVIGRVPITSDNQGVDYVNKLIAYEQRNIVDEQYKGVLVADDPDIAGDFHANSDLFAEQMTGIYGFDNILKLYHPQPTSVSSQMTLNATWEVGLVNYEGHGSATQVGDGNEDFILAENAKILTNTNLPVFVSLTCAAGDFTVPGTSSLAGALVLNPNGGAIVAFAPSGLSIDKDALELGDEFYSSLFGGGKQIGYAAKDAKINSSASVHGFMRRMYSVIGDPAVYAR